MERLKNNKWKIILSCLLSLAPVFIGLILWNRLPEKLPTHFNVNGQADQYSSRAFAVFIPGLFLFALNILALYVTTKDPKNKNVSDKVMDMIYWLIPFIGLYLSILIYGKALGLEMSVDRVSMLLMGGMLLIIGNYLPKCRQNHTIGIRLPWTLKDTEVWDKTHRMAGYLYILTGLVVLIGALIMKENGFILFFVALMINTVITFVYPYVIYRRKHSGEGKEN